METHNKEQNFWKTYTPTQVLSFEQVGDPSELNFRINIFRCLESLIQIVYLILHRKTHIPTILKMTRSLEAAAEYNANWHAALEKVCSSVCVVQSCLTCPNENFNNARATSTTGFLVDAERGLVLTSRSRHYVGQNPSWCQCIFEQGKEVR